MNRNSKLQLVRNLFYSKSRIDLWSKVLDDLTQPHFEVLEIGSGSGRGLQNQFYPQVSRIVGIDLDDRVLSNPYLDQALKISAYDLEENFTIDKFDIVYSHMVAEHIEDAQKFISSQLNCLNNRGVIIHSTVSKYYWTSMINDFVSVKIKNWLIKKLGSGREADDIFPAFYTLNSERQIRKVCDDLNVYYTIIRQDEPPGYLRGSLILMFLYTMLHKPLQFIFPALKPTFIFIISRETLNKY